MSNISKADVAHHCSLLKESNRVVDRKIGVALGHYARRRNKTYGGRIDYVDIRTAGVENWPGHGGDDLVPSYTGSLDYAMDLAVATHHVIAISEEPAGGKEKWEVRLGHRTNAKARVIVAAGAWLPAVLCAAWLLVPEVVEK